MNLNAGGDGFLAFPRQLAVASSILLSDLAYSSFFVFFFLSLKMEYIVFLNEATSELSEFRELFTFLLRLNGPRIQGRIH